MKKLVLIFSAVILSVSLFAGNVITLDGGKTETSLTENSFEKMTNVFSFATIESYDIQTEGGIFTAIQIPGTQFNGEIGNPRLPSTNSLFFVPEGAEIVVNVKNYTTTTYNLSDYGINNKLMPRQAPVSKSAKPGEVEFSYNSAAYDSKGFSNLEIAAVEVMGEMRGMTIGKLTVSPVRYNPSTNQIEVLNNIEVEVTFKGANVAKSLETYQNNFSPYFADAYKAMANKGLYEDHPDLYNYPVRVIVIANRMFEDVLAPWYEWKTEKGFFLDINYTDDIGSSANVLKTFCADKYNNAAAGEKPCFVIVVGDTPQVPASATGSQSGKATDLYYGSIDGDMFPDMYYSRMSATTVGDMENIINKTIMYEKYTFSDPSYLDNVTLIAGVDGNFNPTHGQPTIMYGADNYFNTANGYSDVHIYLTSYSGCFNTVNDGVAFINYTAHGSQTSWADPSLSISGVNSFTNSEKYTVAVGNCCLAADFGYDECFGEAWLRAEDKAAVGYIGSSPSSYWDEDVWWSVGAFGSVGNGVPPPVSETTMGVYDVMHTDTAYNTLCSSVLIGNLAVTQAAASGYGGSLVEYYWQAYNVLGDGSVMPYLKQAQVNSVSHMAIVPLGMDTYDVAAVPGSYAAVSKDGVLLGAAYIGTSGTVSVPITPITSGGDVMIVVTRPQYQPYIQLVPAAALVGAYIVYDDHTVNDASGNDQLEYGEAATLTIDLKNVGTDATSGEVTVTISCSDPELTITDDTEVYPEFAPDQIHGIADAFAIEAGYNIENGHVFAIEIEATDGTDTWSSSLSLVAYAPVLEMTNYTIDDASGNANGFLDPGETAVFTFTVSNVGQAGAENVEGLLTTTDTYLTVITTEAQPFGDLDIGEDGQAIFSVFASEDIPMGHTADLVLNITADHNVTAEGIVSLEWADYCIPTGTNCSLGDEIDDFEFADISNLGTGCSPDGYGDYTAIEGHVDQGSTYDFTVTCNYNSETVSAWVDFNSNGIFTADEMIVADLDCSTAGTSYSTTVTIPSDVYSGSKRLRVRCNWNGSSADPCEVWQYGETEDYTLIVGTVLPAPQNLEAVVTLDDVSLTWEAPEGDAPDGYNLYRNSVSIADDLDVLYYEDLDLEEGSFVYTVKAIFGGIESSGSNMCSVVIDYLVPQNVDTELDGTTITTTWDAVGGKDILGYNIYRNDVKVNDDILDVTTFTDSNLLPDTYCYAVTTVYTAGESNHSEEACEIILSVSNNIEESITIFPVPADLTVTVNAAFNIDELRVYSLTGQLMINELPNSKNITLNTANFEQGVYILNLLVGETTVTRRLVIK